MWEKNPERAEIVDQINEALGPETFVVRKAYRHEASSVGIRDQQTYGNKFHGSAGTLGPAEPGHDNKHGRVEFDTEGGR